MALAVGLSLALSLLMGAALWWRYGPAMAAGIAYSVANGATPGAVVALFFSFSGLALGTFAAVRLAEGRPAATLFGGPVPLVRRHFLRSALAVLSVMVPLAAVAIVTDDTVAARDIAPLVPWYPFAIAGLFVQITAEEALFRGYILQGFAARYRSSFVWLGVPAAMFALGHWQPAKYGDAAIVVVVWAGMFGVMAADLTARTGTLGAAMGFHFASNGVALFLIGTRGDLDGMAAFVLPAAAPTLAGDVVGIAVIFVTTLAGWLAVRVALRV